MKLVSSQVALGAAVVSVVVAAADLWQLTKASGDFAWLTAFVWLAIACTQAVPALSFGVLALTLRGQRTTSRGARVAFAVSTLFGLPIMALGVATLFGT